MQAALTTPDNLAATPQALCAAALDWLEPRSIAALAALQLGVSAEQIRRTVEYVERMAGQDAPFFVSLHYTAPHWPLPTVR
mgnify:CR=1 FL=1